MKGERGVEFVSVKKNSSLQHKLWITCEVSRGFVPDCSFILFSFVVVVQNMETKFSDILLQKLKKNREQNISLNLLAVKGIGQ